jgi:hypothetical protein
MLIGIKLTPLCTSARTPIQQRQVRRSTLLSFACHLVLNRCATTRFHARVGAHPSDF